MEKYKTMLNHFSVNQATAIMTSTATIESHEIVSEPRPHILYNIKIVINDKEFNTQKRYSDVSSRSPSAAVVSSLFDL